MDARTHGHEQFLELLRNKNVKRVKIFVEITKGGKEGKTFFFVREYLLRLNQEEKTEMNEKKK